MFGASKALIPTPCLYSEKPMTDLIEKDLSCERWRAYDLPGRSEPYIIRDPVTLYYRPGGTTHRIVDNIGVVHCVPSVGVGGCVLRWFSRNPAKPVAF